jgi:hypothetical protein
MIILADVSDQALTGRLLQIRKDERRLLVECLGCLAELDRRKTVLSLGYGSLFSFCTDFLSMTKASAFRRTTAARLLARFPVVADYLADGRLNLTTLVELRDVLDEAHLVEILDRAAGRTEDQVKELVASLRPQPAPADLLRRLPGPRNDSGGSGPVPPATNGPSAALAAPPAFLPPPVPARETAVQVGRPQAARLHPIAPEQHVLRVTVSAEFVASLEAARRALSHKLPGGELAEVLHEGLHAILANADRRRRGTGKKSSPSMPPPGSRYVPAAVRDEVWRRDGGQCRSSAAPATAAPPATNSRFITCTPSLWVDRRSPRTSLSAAGRTTSTLPNRITAASTSRPRSPPGRRALAPLRPPALGVTGLATSAVRSPRPASHRARGLTPTSPGRRGGSARARLRGQLSRVPRGPCASQTPARSCARRPWSMVVDPFFPGRGPP